MQTVTLEDLDLNHSYFHFTNKDNVALIATMGIIPMMGEHTAKGERTAKTFFSQGIEGSLEICDAWLKWLLNKNMTNYFNDYSNFKSRTDWQIQHANWEKEFLSKAYQNDEIKKQRLFSQMSSLLTTSNYLILALEPNVDFNPTDIDENKVLALKNKDSYIYKYLRVMYEPYSNTDSPIMDKWNMHTLSNHKVPIEKISILTDNNGKKLDSLTVLINMYDIYKTKNPAKVNQFSLLNDFISYSKTNLNSLS
jgi:hypothetical protein